MRDSDFNCVFFRWWSTKWKCFAVVSVYCVSHSCTLSCFQTEVRHTLPFCKNNKVVVLLLLLCGTKATKWTRLLLTVKQGASVVVTWILVGYLHSRAFYHRLLTLCKHHLFIASLCDGPAFEGIEGGTFLKSLGVCYSCFCSFWTELFFCLFVVFHYCVGLFVITALTFQMGNKIYERIECFLSSRSSRRRQNEWMNTRLF